MLHHVQIAAPAGSEDRLRAFYSAALGWTEMTGPTLAVSMDEMVERYGPWPGPVPERPAALG